MAVSVYYGTCITEAKTAKKVVRIKDSEITTNDFEFGVGDLLVVYFSNMNTAPAPSLVVTNGDTEEEVSTSDDTGKFVKTNSIEEIEDPEGIWDNGETVIFAYTKNVSNNNNVYYWELIDAARASEVISGVTKLYGNIDTNISEWLNEDLKEEDFNKALTPGILKKFFKSLMGGEEQSSIKLNWVPASTASELESLGQLSLSTAPDSGITINFPLDSYVRERIGQNISKTSDIANDGPNPNNPDNVTTDGGFYITNVLPEGKSLYSGSTNYAFLTPNSNGNLILRSNGDNTKIQLNGVKGTSITNGLTVSGASTFSGNMTTGNINATSGYIKATNDIYEKGATLKSRYSGIFIGSGKDAAKSGKFTVAKNSSSGHRKITGLKKNGYTLKGIVGFNINYTSSNGQDATWCSLWECHVLNASEIEYAVRNYSNKAVNIEIIFDLLWVKNN